MGASARDEKKAALPMAEKAMVATRARRSWVGFVGLGCPIVVSSSGTRTTPTSSVPATPFSGVVD